MFNDAGQTLAGECCGVKARSLTHECSVDGYALSSHYFNEVTHLDLSGIYCPALAALNDDGMVGTDGNQGLDVVAGAAHGAILQRLADAVECHHRHRLGVFPDGKGADACHRHQ